MDRLTGNQSTAHRPRSSSTVRVLAQALQVFDDHPPRNRMEFAVSRKLTEQMRRIMRQPASVAHVFRLSAEFPAVEALLDDFLMNVRIARSRASDCAVLDQLIRRLTNP
jgi:hypothetical protein